MYYRTHLINLFSRKAILLSLKKIVEVAIFTSEVNVHIKFKFNLCRNKRLHQTNEESLNSLNHDFISKAEINLHLKYILFYFIIIYIYIVNN